MHLSRAIGDRVHLVSIPAASDGAAPVESEGLFTIIWGGKWLVAAGGLTALLIGAFYAYILATPLYHATAVLRLLPEQEQIIDFPNGAGRFSGDRAELNSEVEVLRGRGLLAQVAERLNLTADPEFSARFQSEEAQQVRDAVISKLLEAVTIRNIPQSRVLRVTVESEDARKAALIADTIVELYVSHQIETKEKAAEQAVVWLTERVTAMQTNLQTAEAKVAAFNASTELVSVVALRGLERQIKELRGRIVTAQEARAASERQNEALETAVTSAEKVNASGDAQLAGLFDGMEEEPALGRAFEARFQTVLQRSREDLFRSQQQLAALRTSEAELSAQVSQQSRDLITLQQLTREAEAARVLYEHFLSRLNEAMALQGNHRAHSRILSHAVVPLRPSTPRRTLIIAMSAVFGLLASLAIVLGREMQRDGFRTARELEAATGHPVLGQIPKMPLKGANVAQYLADAPTSGAAEALRDVRTSVLRLNAGGASQVIVITGSVAGEGATTAAIALAQSLHGLKKSVLLIDGDIRACGLTRHFSGSLVKALGAVLREDAALEEGIQSIGSYGLDALLCGESDQSTSDLFASDCFKRLIEKARQAYDAVIIDTPPILFAPTGRIVAEQADATLLMVQSDRTCRGKVEEALRVFRNSGQSITGTVFNQARAG